MNKTQYLLAKLAEESVEVAQRALKAQVFGVEEVQPGQALDNTQRLIGEFTDLVAVYEMLNLPWPQREAIEAKKHRVVKYSLLSQQQGQLSEPLDPIPGKYFDTINRLKSRFQFGKMDATSIPGLVVHHPSKCEGRHCCIHNPSDHHMKDWPLHWRQDRGIMERTCPHGIGHPDPDDAAHRASKGDTDSVHGCDGCCDPENHGSH